MSVFLLSSANPEDLNREILESVIAEYDDYLKSILNAISVLGVDTTDYYNEFKENLNTIEINDFFDKRLTFYDGKLVEASLVPSTNLIQIPDVNIEIEANDIEEREFMLRYAFDSYRLQFQEFVTEVYATTSILSPFDYENALNEIERLYNSVMSRINEIALETKDMSSILFEVC